MGRIRKDLNVRIQKCSFTSRYHGFHNNWLLFRMYNRLYELHYYFTAYISHQIAVHTIQHTHMCVINPNYDFI